MARAFAAEGCERIAITDRNAELLAAVQRDILSRHGDDGNVRVLAIPGDIADPAFAQGLVGEVVARFGRLDYAVNCAGVPSTGQRCTETSLDDFDRINCT